MSKHIAILFLSGLIGITQPSFGDEAGTKLGPAHGGAYKDFTFNRIKPPASGSGKRITIQIAPDLTAPKIVAKSKEVAKPAGQDIDWFWNVVGPGIDAAKPGRFAEALQHIETSPEGKTIFSPKLSNLQKIAKEHGATILVNTVGKNISPALVLAVISVESGGKPTAQSNKGAQGLMQLIPATAERFGVKDANEPKDNIKGGVAYLAWLLKEFDNDPILALAGYNAGENAVKKHSGVPPYNETRNYIPKVLAAWKVASGLCMTPPQLPSDGCVFRTE